MADIGAGAVRLVDSAGEAMDDTSSGALKIKVDSGGGAYQEDAQHTGGNDGTFVLAVRKDSDGSLVDTDGDYAPFQVDSSGRLKVALAAHSSIDIGDVSLLLGGTAADTNAGAMSAQTLRVTLATDDTHFGAVGAAADADGNIHGQLRYIADELTTIDEDTGGIKTDTNSLVTSIKTTGVAFSSSDIGYGAIVVRNDTLANLDGTVADGDNSLLQVNSIGALYVTGESKQQTAVTDYGFGIMGEAKVIDGSTLPNTVAEGNAGRIAMSRSSIMYTCLTDDAGASDLGTTITTHLSEIEGAVETIEGAISGSELQVDVVAALPAGSNAIGKLAANSGVDIGDVDVTSIIPGTGATNLGKAIQSAQGSTDTGVPALVVRNDVLDDLTGGTDGDYAPIQVSSNGAVYVTHGMKGIVSEVNDDVGTSPEDLRAAGDISCRRVDMMASPANTGYIWVGDASVANDGTGGGIRLAPGDFYSVDVNSINDLHVAATVSGEDIMYTYYT
tara:strand:- start:713 stop:2215 length:1503 start_codon:yes stop_codon:yes gene_type:complete